MIIDIDRLSLKGLEVNRDFEFFNSELLEEEAVFLEPVHTEIVIKRAGEEVFITGRIRTTLSLLCSRCLSPFDFHIDSDFDLAYFPEEMEEEKEQLGAEDLLQNFYYDKRIDLRKIILEQLNLTLPARPLCSEDCPGICPVCGRNIRVEGCICDSGSYDPRLGKLKTLLKDGK